MSDQKTYTINSAQIWRSRWADFTALVKLRLTNMVIITAGLGYAFAAGSAFAWLDFFAVMLGGFFITGAANAFNEILEKDTDALMDRTVDRPIPAGRMNISSAIILAGALAVSGITLLGLYFNTLTALIGAVSLISYSFIYTPLKRVGSVAVFMGAIPGALPPLIGWVAFKGYVGPEAILLFAIQFLWQFPHFWAVAWIAHDDYKKAGFHLLPSPGGKDKASAFQNIVYCLFLIPVGLLPFGFGLTGWISATVAVLAGGGFTWYAWRLYRTCSDKSARGLMFASFLYLPVVLLALVLDKI